MFYANILGARGFSFGANSTGEKKVRVGGWLKGKEHRNGFSLEFDATNVNKI